MSGLTSSQLRRQLVDSLHLEVGVRDGPIAAAFLRVPREAFLPGHELADVYRDQAITTKQEAGVPVSSSSQPGMMAAMLKQLELRPGMRVLEIGAGTGYNAALLQELVGDSGEVTSLEIDPEVAGWAKTRLTEVGYDRVQVIEVDGGGGWVAGAPYDRIELTVGTADISSAWFDQLAPGGILVVPLWISTYQICIAFEKRDRSLVSQSAVACGFMRIRGQMAGADQYRVLLPNVMIATGSAAPGDDLLRDLIAQTPRTQTLEGRNWHGFVLFMALHEPSMLMLASTDAQVTGFSGGVFGVTDESDRSLCLFSSSIEGEGEAMLYSYGGERAHERLLTLVERWRASGEPDVGDVEIQSWLRAIVARHPADAVIRETDRWRYAFRFRHVAS
ncbi:MAG: rRNA adenine N-6-methyltransferase family protein [Nitrolancea sp.]